MVRLRAGRTHASCAVARPGYRHVPLSAGLSSCGLLRAVALLELLTRTAPTRIVPSWLDLGEPAQVDALAQVVHVVEVLAPALVDDLEQQVALDLAQDLGADLLLARLVERLGVLLEHRRQLAAVERRVVELVEVEARDE